VGNSFAFDVDFLLINLFAKLRSTAAHYGRVVVLGDQ